MKHLKTTTTNPKDLPFMTMNFETEINGEKVRVLAYEQGDNVKVMIQDVD